MSKLNIKEEMRAIDTKDRPWFDSLTDEEKKKLSPWLLMRYTSNCNDKMFTEHYLEWTNEVVNVHFNKLRKHTQLQFQLLQLVGLGKPVFHAWIQPGKAQKKNKLQAWIAENYNMLNDDEIDWIDKYHEKVYKNLSGFMQEKELVWLKKSCEPILQ